MGNLFKSYCNEALLDHSFTSYYFILQAKIVLLSCLIIHDATQRIPYRGDKLILRFKMTPANFKKRKHPDMKRDVFFLKCVVNYSSRRPFVLVTPAALSCIFAFSASLKGTSTMRSIPFFPKITGTPMQISFRPYSPSR